MAKKTVKTVRPEDQSEELRRAKFELIMRNPEERQKLTDLFARHEKKRDEITTRLASIGGKLDPEQKQRWDFLFSQSEVPCDQEFAAYLKKIEPPNAVNSVWRWLDYTMEIEHARMMLPWKPGVSHALSYEELKERVLKMYHHDAEGIFAELTNDRPAVHLLLGVDLTRSKEVIMAEVGKLVDEYQTKLGKHEVAGNRFKWLSIFDELLKVWDAWAEYGQRRCFHLVAKKLDMPESTVKARWRLAYRLINRVEYSKEVAASSADGLCAKCQDQAKCYRTVNGQMDFYPCPAYLKLTGKSYTREKLLENFDAVADQYAADNFEG